MTVYKITYTTPIDWNRREIIFGYYSSKEKAERIMNKIIRIQKLTEELERDFEHCFLDSLAKHFEDFHITKIRIH